MATPKPGYMGKEFMSRWDERNHPSQEQLNQYTYGNAETILHNGRRIAATEGIPNLADLEEANGGRGEDELPRVIIEEKTCSDICLPFRWHLVDIFNILS